MTLSSNLWRLLKPKNVAIVGGDDAAFAARQCTSFGFRGDIWTINRNRPELGGQRCLQKLSDLPVAPDATFLGVSRSATLPIVRNLRELGAGGVICYAAGFAEIGTDGQKLQEALVAEAGDLALLGPNCYGLINATHRFALWPYFHGCRAVSRGPALISQSGMLATSLTMNTRSVDFSYVISVGNQAKLGAEDFVEALLNDSRVSAFALYTESIRDIARFAKIASKARAAGKPIVSLRAGVSSTASMVVLHHTGPTETPSYMLDDLLTQCGILQVQTPSELLETLKLISNAPLLKGRRIVAITCSGGDAAILADCGVAKGLCFPQPSPTVTDRLRALLPDFATVSNPLDVTTQLWGKVEMLKIFDVMLQDDYDVALFVQDWPRSDIPFDKGVDLQEAAHFATKARERGIPALICSSLQENIDRDTRQTLLSFGAIPMQGFAEAMTAVAQASLHGDIITTSKE